ncbi:hypothetical protein N7495_008751 [Penicillium taxi]|uniref:uncharacterized protein n=1 Tax=Penicillium taxi TaxID=168475 RepID=UPI002544D702|nr:uncharacterized protein N7495_008751 [Penicillium taxi]KAJ5888710.1 hypothetical protein N7495_008751 [Penicillium taxi]
MSIRQKHPREPLLQGRWSQSFAILVISVAIFTDNFLYLVVVPVIPWSITERVGVRPEDVQFWTSCLLAVHSAGLLVSGTLSGYIADHVSRRLPYLIGLCALAGSTLLLCLGRTIGLIALGRVLQGVSSGVVWTVGLAILVDQVGPDHIGYTMGYIGIAVNAGTLMGPVFGGIVMRQAGYYAVFAMCLALVTLDIIFRFCLPDKPARLSFFDPEANGSVYSYPGQPSSLESSPLLSHNLVQNTTTRPVVIHLLRSRRLLVALWGTFMQSVLICGFYSVLPLFVWETFGWDAMAAGLIFLPIALPCLLGPLLGTLTDQWGPRYIGSAGFLLAAPCLIVLQTVAEDTLICKVILAVLLLLVGISLQAVLPPTMAEICFVVDNMEQEHPEIFGYGSAYAQAFGLSCTSFAAGTAVGPIWAGFMREKFGWTALTWSLGAVSVLTGVAMGTWLGVPSTKEI